MGVCFPHMPFYFYLIAAMKRMNLLLLAMQLLSILPFAAFSQVSLFNDDWKFHRGGAQRAEMPDYNDHAWRVVHLPHDWSIEDLPGKNSPFDSLAVGQVSTGFTAGGTGWYRKTFHVPASLRDKKVQLQFDGIYMNADIWINGIHLTNHPYGYTSSIVDITKHLKYDQDNVVAVQVKNEGQNSRWYTGSGIYRHVWLRVTEQLHIEPWGVSIESKANGEISVSTTLNNLGGTSGRVRLVTQMSDADGSQSFTQDAFLTLPDNGKITQLQQFKVSSPQLWSVESPKLYTAYVQLYKGDRLLDSTHVRFGIRSISFDVNKGFALNGKPMKLKGGCVHHDNGPLGAKAFDRAEERRIALLKASGFNAIRCAHNPPSQAFLDACDRLGMLVIDEAFDMWRLPNNPHDYHLYFDKHWKSDIESMVYRDRNHPSIIMWSIGNEIKEMENPAVIEVAKMLRDHIKSIDTTRPVTAAVNNLRPQKDPYFSVFDVAGYNYAAGGDHLKKSIYSEDHDRVPARVMYGSESYPLEAFSAWMGVVDHPWVIGDFVWTAFDYIGEASIGWRGYWQESNFFPWNLAYCGDIDICGWKRPQSYYRDALWKQNQLSIFVRPPSPSFPINPDKQSWSKWEWDDVVSDWNWKGNEGRAMEVVVYSSCPAVELFLNGRSLGKQKTDRSNKFTATFKVDYQPGVLKAVGIDGKRAVANAILQTTSTPAAIKLTADRQTIVANNQDLSYVNVEIVDNAGVRNPKFDGQLSFTIDGPATIIAVANANPVSIESYQSNKRKAWRGRCMVILRSTKQAGIITLQATANGLPSGSVRITSATP